MNPKRLQAELWEIQVILYWMLSLSLFITNHPNLGWACLVWSFIVIGGILMKLKQANEEDKK